MINSTLRCFIFFFNVHIPSSLHKQAAACCKYVQVLCKLLIGGGDDRMPNSKAHSAIRV